MKLKSNSWMYVVVGVVMLLFDGMVYAWSVLQIPIAAYFSEWTKTQLSLTFTLCICFFCLGGLLAGKLSRKINPRFGIILASVLFCAGFMIASRATTLVVLYLGFGVLGGLASGIAYNIVMSTMSRRFADKQGLVSGILLMGFGLGSFFIGKIYQAVTPSGANVDAWRTSFFWMGIILLVVLAAGNAFFVWPDEASLPKVTKKRTTSVTHEQGLELTTAEMLKRPSFWLFFSWVILLSFAGMALISQASGIAQEISPTSSGGTIATIVGLISIFNGIGRVIFGGMFDRLGRKRTILTINLAWVGSIGVLAVAMLLNSFALLIASFIFCGFSYGGITPTNSAFINRFYGAQNYPSNFSVVNMNLLVASVGGTAAGLIYDAYGSYFSAIVLMAAAVLLATVTSSLIRRP